MINDSKPLFPRVKNIIIGTPIEKPLRYLVALFRSALASKLFIKSKIVTKYFFNDLLDYCRIKHSINTPLSRQIKKIISRTSAQTISELRVINQNQPSLLIATSYGFTPYMMAVESTIALMSKFNDLQPYFLMCDESLPACEWNRWGNHIPDPGKFNPSEQLKKFHNCSNCINGFNDIISELPFPIIKLKKYLKDIDYDKLHRLSKDIPPDEYFSFTYKNIKVGEDAFASTTRTLQIGVLDLNDEETSWIYQRYFFSGLLLVELFEKLFQESKPDYIFAVHGVYITHGILGQVARKHNINISFWDGPWYYPVNRNQIRIEKNYAPVISLRNKYESSSLYEFNDNIDRSIFKFINEKRLDASIHHGVKNPINNTDKVIEYLKIDISRPVVSVFTNVTYDSATFYPSKLFNNIFEWLFFVIDYYKDIPLTQLIIRAHPSESIGIGTRQPAIDEIKERYPILPENISLIEADSNISTYTVIDLSDLVLSFSSTVGLDATIIGKPSIIVAKSSYSFVPVFNPESIEEYIDMLDNYFDLKVTEKMRRDAISIAYDYHFKSKIHFPYVNIKNHVNSDGLKLTYRKFDELTSLKLDDICNNIMN